MKIFFFLVSATVLASGIKSQAANSTKEQCQSVVYNVQNLNQVGLYSLYSHVNFLSGHRFTIHNVSASQKLGGGSVIRPNIGPVINLFFYVFNIDYILPQPMPTAF